MTSRTHIFRDPPTDPIGPGQDHWRPCTAEEAQNLREQGFEVRRVTKQAPLRSYGRVWVRSHSGRRRSMEAEIDRLMRRARKRKGVNA